MGSLDPYTLWEERKSKSITKPKIIILIIPLRVIPSLQRYGKSRAVENKTNIIHFQIYVFKHIP